jgi:hypothetical protein
MVGQDFPQLALTFPARLASDWLKVSHYNTGPAPMNFG